METVQIVLDKKLLQDADRAARRTKQNRSALVREALREHLRRLEVCALEERDREGYSKHAPASGESRLWETEAAWPAE
jgi:metal-responsive CopG/Arc/MetJ family transcriptional regulator